MKEAINIMIQQDFVPSGRIRSERTDIFRANWTKTNIDECQLDEDNLDELVVLPK